MMIDLVNPTATAPIVKFKNPKNVNVNAANATSLKPLNTLIFKKPVFTAGAKRTTETSVKKAKKSNGRHRQEEKKGFKLAFVKSKGDHACRLCGTNCVTMKLFSRHQSRRYSYEELEKIFASSKMCSRRRDNEVVDVDQLEDRDEDVLQAARILMFMSNDHQSEVRVKGLKKSVDVGCKRVHEFDLNMVVIDVEEENELMI